VATEQVIEKFIAAARLVGTEVCSCASLAEAADYIAERLTGTLLLPVFSSSQRHGLVKTLTAAGIEVEESLSRETAPGAQGGLTGVNFAMADTGTLALESTAEDIRLATTLPEIQFALLDPEKILADSLLAVEPMRQLHQRDPRNYIAYVTGPSRTADIERVLTIGVHGPKQLHVLLVPNLSNDPLEM